MKILLLLFLLLFEITCAPEEKMSYLTNDSRLSITADSSGISAENFRFSPQRLFPKKNWQGDWIWLNKLKYPGYQKTFTTWIEGHSPAKKYKALFRKTFELAGIPSSAILCITADVSFRAFLNGKFICKGPANIGSDYEDHVPPGHWFFTTHGVKSHLQTGKNVLAVEVYAFDLALSETTSGKGKLICDLDAGINQTILSTDSSWKCHLDTCFSGTKEGLTYDAGDEISGWQSQDFNDSDWPTGSIIMDAKKNFLINSQIPVTIQHSVDAAKIWENTADKQITKTGSTPFHRELHDECFTLDFGRNIPAYYSFSLTAHRGDTLTIHPREKSAVNRPFVYICKEGKNRFTTPQLNVFRYLSIEVSSDKGLKIESLQATYSSYPVSYRGSFSCSDTFYTLLWDISRWTTQMCMQDLYLDSPRHQEPLACTGDYLIESLSNYYAFADPWLARQDLIKTAKMLQKNKYNMFHTSYALLWVQMLYNYFMYTGDGVLVTELLPQVNKLNDRFAGYLDEDFILSQAPDYMFMDWIKIDEFNAHHPPAVIGMGYLSAFYYQSLMIAASLNEMNDNKLKCEENLQLAAKIRNGINQSLWDGNKGIYKDGIPFKSRIKPHVWLPADEDIVTYSPHMNTLAVLYDIAPSDKQAAIMNYVVQQQDIELQPYFMYFVLAALDHIGQFDSRGLIFLNKWEMGIDQETYTLKENWQDKTEFGYAGDFSHAWGGSPLYFMSAIILGITPGKPGYKEIHFVPYVSDHLTWAKGSVPLTDGRQAAVSWQRRGQAKYIFQLKVPEHHQAVLHHPGRFQSYRLRINQTATEKTEKSMILAPGDYTIEYTKA